METILIILKAIPALKDAVDRFIAFYVQQEYLAMKKANQDGIKKAIEQHDQRSLEAAIGSTKAGEVSNRPGAIVVPDDYFN
jgi:hypothetical protein